ncbi:MAG TPA: gluconate 2-dehydrogenase subunit 3 family protein [Terriglobales bacterium]|jgi:gluconate 2-dehydrogenase gamma chain|nr:gluconate 2-dehydrogenase subunit 3 family protein [Terriglobales bacterium]
MCNAKNMPSPPISRRDILRTLALGAAGGSVLQIIPLQAAAQVHRMISHEKSSKPGAAYKPKFFAAHQYQTLTTLCNMIIPADNHSGGAVEAGAPEFIDLLTSENKHWQLQLGGGLMWLDSICIDRYGRTFLDSSFHSRKEILDQIAYRKNVLTDPAISQGVEFFAFLRKLTADGFYSSEIGIKDLQYIGNTALKEFPGCPTPPES